MSQTQGGIVHQDSIDSQDPNIHPDGKKPKNRRPGNTAFRQQRLKAWQPILTPKTVLPLFFGLGIIFAPLGGALLYASSQVQELVLDYTTCFVDAPQDGTFGAMPADKITHYFKQDTNASSQASWRTQNVSHTYDSGVTINDTIQCSIQFTIPSDMDPPVLFYYQLTNFYQNHRRYVKSFSADQLDGKAVAKSTISGSDCDPLDIDDATGKPYYPCGLVANSIFNDTFFSPVLLNPGDTSAANETYYMKNNSGIAWSSDKDLYGKSNYSVDDVVPPPNWHERYPNGYTAENPIPDVSTNEAFQVWMRTAGLPTFSKLYQRNDSHAMKQGQYQVDILMNFNTTLYDGTKSIILTTRTVMGGRNPFLGIAYIVVGGICIILGGIFTVTHLIKPRKLGDHTYLSWNNEQPSTATASGRDGGAGGSMASRGHA